MKIARNVKAVLIAGIVASCMLVMTACSAPATSQTDGVAAIVNGHEISEQAVTDEVDRTRSQSGLSDDDLWGKFLVQNDMTPESVRENAIDSLVEKELIKEGAADLEIAVDDAEVDEAVSSFKANFGSDESWQSSLKQAGFTEETYRQTIDSSITEQKISEHFQEGVVPTDEENVEAAKTYASYYDGAKRSSHILFTVEDANDQEQVDAAKKQAEEVLAQINAGTLDFATAVSEYSGDEASKANGGDVGWDKLNSFVSEYTTALTDLDAGQTTAEPVQSDYGFHIIRVTEVFNAPEEDAITSLDQIPADFRDNIQEMAVSVKANTRYSDWLAEIKEAAEIEIKPMPEGLPYDIDLAPYEEEAAEEEAEEAESGTDATSTEDLGLETTGDGSEAAIEDASLEDTTALDQAVDEGADSAIEGAADAADATAAEAEGTATAGSSSQGQ